MNNSDLINHIKDYFNGRHEVIAVYLFGSYAKGGEKKGSDVDIGILLKHKVICSETQLHSKYLIGLAKVTRKDFHFVFMNKAGENILAQIFKYGKCILNKSPYELSVFKMIKLSMIADFSYSLNIMKNGFLDKMFGVDK